MVMNRLQVNLGNFLQKMIQYTLKCDKGHTFDSWFQSSSAFEKLQASKMIVCSICGTSKIEKAIMAPRVNKNTKISIKKKSILRNKQLQKLKSMLKKTRTMLAKILPKKQEPCI